MFKQVLWVTILVAFFSASNVIGYGDGSSNEATLNDAFMQCNETFRIETSYLESLNETGSFSDETDRTPKCFLMCVLNKTGVATSDGLYDPARTAAVYADMRPESEETLEEIAKSCMDRKEACKCEKAYQYIKCMIEKAIDMETASTKRK